MSAIDYTLPPSHVDQWYPKMSEKRWATALLTPDALVSTNMHAILRAEAHHTGYESINGPCLMKVPSWIPQPLGRYYLYFAHHEGRGIYLAYSDRITGPWQVYDQPILELHNTQMMSVPGLPSSWDDVIPQMGPTEREAIRAMMSSRAAKSGEKTPDTDQLHMPHIASPEVIIDEKYQTIKLYYHGIVSGSIQMTRYCTSVDGISFRAHHPITGLAYMRCFYHRDMWYGIAMPGVLYRSPTGLSSLEVRERTLLDPDVRHIGLLKRDNMLYIFHSRVGDSPERILSTEVDLTATDWDEWSATQPCEVARPEEEWEGSAELIQPSQRGAAKRLVHELRDPYVYEEDNELYLLYSGGGESGIGIRKLYQAIDS